MANSVFFTNRVETARKAAEFGKVLDTNGNGLARVVTVPGHESKQYNVILWRENGCIETECNLVTPGGPVPCPGNGKTVCYHSMAALVVAANKNGKKLSFCSNKVDADRLARTSRGQTIRVASRTSQGEIWAVAG